MPPNGSVLWRNLVSYQIFGANTGVGKTVVSTILCSTAARSRPQENVWYLKPVSTGPLNEADDRHLRRHAQVKTACLWQFDDPVSPHLAAGNEAPTDNKILQYVRQSIQQCAEQGPGFHITETAGGVHSPTPWGSSQADAYRPLRLPVVLVADYQLGGISTTMAALEALHIRGYDVLGVAVFSESRYQNASYLREVMARRGIPVFELPLPPEKGPEDELRMQDYYDSSAKLDISEEMISTLKDAHKERLEYLDSMADRANNLIWYPFTQHGLLSAKDITTIDSAYGDHFQTISSDSTLPDNVLQSSFDASASWWTQGLGHGNPDLMLTAANAAGRYGHVMFASAVHEPALKLAELVAAQRDPSKTLGLRVFYSDNGSTGMEVALKMALRTACTDYEWDASKDDISILGLKGSYHGDTIGVMDASEPSTYNKKVEWYRGRGFWFDYPKVQMSEGRWKVKMPEGMGLEDESHDQLGRLFAKSRHVPEYDEYIDKKLSELIESGERFGALVLEPILLGAGGMNFCDPKFQKQLVNRVRSTNFGHGGSTKLGIPVIYDEVFTGMYRLGRPSSGSFIGPYPDISVHAKTMTGGLVPLCVTVATDRIYRKFLSKDKTDSLLHGHSYTAHPIGCAVAVKSMETMRKMDETGAWDNFKESWATRPGKDTDASTRSVLPPLVWSTWSHDFVKNISWKECVDGVFAIGSVLAIEMKDPKGKSYTSTAALEMKEILATEQKNWNIHSRILGNVIYFMASQTSKVHEIRTIEGRIMRAASIISHRPTQEKVKKGIKKQDQDFKIVREDVPRRQPKREDLNGGHDNVDEVPFEITRMAEDETFEKDHIGEVYKKFSFAEKRKPSPKS